MILHPKFQFILYLKAQKMTEFQEGRIRGLPWQFQGRHQLLIVLERYNDYADVCRVLSPPVIRIEAPVWWRYGN